MITHPSQVPRRGLASRGGVMDRMGSTAKADLIQVRPIGTVHRSQLAELMHTTQEKKKQKAEEWDATFGTDGTYWPTS